MKKFLLSLLCAMASVCLFAQVSYTTSFETTDDNAAWGSVSKGANKLVIGSATKTDGSLALYVSKDGTSYSYDADSKSTAAFYHRIYLDGGATYTFSFKYKSDGESTVDYGKFFVVKTSEDVIATDINANGDNNISRGLVKADLDEQSDFTTYTKTVTALEGGYYYAIFYWDNDESDADKDLPLAVDEFSISSTDATSPFDYVAPAGDPFNYSTGFEATDDNSKWKFTTAGGHCMMLGANCGNGSAGIYISSNGADWRYWEDDGGSGNVANGAYVPFNVETGVTYTIKFDWICMTGVNPGNMDFSGFGFGYAGIAFDEPNSSSIYSAHNHYTGKTNNSSFGVDLVPSCGNANNPFLSSGNSEEWTTGETCTWTADRTATVYLYFAFESAYGGFWDSKKPLSVDNVSISAGAGAVSGLGFVEGCSDNYPEAVNATICSGETYVFGNTPYSEAGTYEFAKQNSDGCYDHYTLNLQVKNCIPVANVPYFLSFEENETDLANWGLYSLNDASSFDITAEESSCGDRALTFKNEGADIAIAYREFQLENNKEYTVSFDWKGSCNDDMAAASLYYGYFPDGIEDAMANPMTLMAQVADMAENTYSNSWDMWNSESFTFTAREKNEVGMELPYNPEGKYYVILMYNYFDSEDEDAYFMLDNFAITDDGSVPACPYVAEYDMTVELVGNPSYTTAQIKVTPGEANPDVEYTIVKYNQSGYEWLSADQTDLEMIKENISWGVGTTYNGVQTITLDELDSETDYVVFVVVVERGKTIDTNVHKLTFSTKAYNLNAAVAVSDILPTSAKLNVTPEDTEIEWNYMFFSQAEKDEKYKGDEGYFDNSVIVWECTNEPQTGVKSIDMTGLTPETDYYVLFWRVVNGMTFGQVQELPFKTLADFTLALDKEAFEVAVYGNETVVATVENGIDGIEVVWTSSNEEVATVDGGVVTGVAVGEATITATYGDKSVTVNVTVVKAAQTITWEQAFDNIKVGAEVELNATASSELDVTYAITEGAEFATIEDGKVTFTGEGTVVIVASQAGNDSYEAAADVTKSITVLPVSVDNAFVNVTVYTFGGQIVVEGLEANVALSVFNVEGKLIYTGMARTIAVPTSGVYMLNVGKSTVKVAVK